ncbi:hypothetical protein BO86DRAFT_395000 [Aspergillus japonicus CBS 114.51]|uniref:Altered inheritance of mitochondria protein 21 n=2 Tax=Aspergillus TaxID=5052 RepID=A0A2V5GZI8_ASPV1|nr:hypothetical protein BO86DRAFT_395000 [Aspergillus japonicus CBS 114.51]PYI13803.1 hypothetical protein BO99DRAFT_346539 [Aspergillus violaceofuscus CBS 115571]RAH87221.1 hypothetical protein BO86DRAFT_395000 [Aspergillus japonicus CBS 114.51]
MTTQAAPAIPPRPSRSPQQNLAPASAEGPKIPPRPSNRAERSVSPFPDSYAPSPLNDLPNGWGLKRTTSNDLPQRPPSVTIPSLGQEGIEYQDLDVANVSEAQQATPPETRNVGSDLKLHAPRPSLPTSSAKARVQAVTRTDSRQAAAAGLGRAPSPSNDDHPERPTRSLHSRASGSRGDSSTMSADRRQSFHGEEHGIPEIGQRVPMYPNAGDVQAPSPSPYLEPQEKRSGRNHHRTRSGREASLPPGSYGLHGHGVPSNDKFEKAWYEKHPEEFVREEQGQYGPGVGTPRPDWALSSDDLNKIVRGSAVNGSGLGTSPALAGTPDEEVGYIASDEYTHQLASPGLDSRRNSRLAVESPLRNSSFPATDAQAQPETAVEQETDDKSTHSRVIHVDEPYHHLHHPDGFAQTPGPEELTHNLDLEEEKVESILAADEVRPESAFQHPAVSPTFGRNGSVDYEGRSRTPSVTHSRSNSRTASIHSGMPALARYNSRDEHEGTHTPLEDVEEYEPLFPEDESKDQKPITPAERFKQRPDQLKHRFPSQDIWEDSPNSLQLSATVSTPDIPKEEAFETPEQESNRKSQAPQIDAHKVASHILGTDDREGRPSRPEISKQRFPSRDIWEDAPESHTLVTTVQPAEEEVKSPEVPSKPSIPLRPLKRPGQAPPVDASSKPVTSPTDKRQPPSIPDRPKPQIPARPSKAFSRASPEEAKDIAAKPKPAIPARPGGSKIAALKAGFLSDLNSRLQLGPQAPPKPQEKKEEEAPAEKVPLSDARKGRARGPARRKPAVEKTPARLPTIPEVKITETWNVWQMGEDGTLTVGDEKPTTAPSPSETTAPEPMAPPIAKNLAGESAEPQAPATALEKEEARDEPVSPGAVAPAAAPADVSPTQETLPEPVPEPTFTEAKHSIPLADDNSTAVPAPAVDPVTTDDLYAGKPTIVSPPDGSPIDDIAARLSASADGKRPSEGDIGETIDN